MNDQEHHHNISVASRDAKIVDNDDMTQWPTKFSIVCQHNLVDETLKLYYSAYVKHVALSFYSLFHYHSIANICTHPYEI
jgi:hypothetical protein